MADTIKSVDVPSIHGLVALNPDGTTLGTPVGGATSANQTNGSQKTQIVDGSGNVIGSTSNALNVHIASGSSSGTQYTEGDTDISITGTAVMWEDTSDTLRVVSSAKPLPVTVNNITGIGNGIKTITSAGTDEVLSSSTACKRICIQSQTDNTGLIAVGTSGVDATIATGTGIILYPGDIFELDIDNLSDVYIDATVSGEGVRYTYFT